MSGSGGKGVPARMDPPTFCAYNQTRECFLGLEVSATADVPVAALTEKLKTTVLRSGEGVWIAPFQPLPEAEIPAPLDLFYLDEEGRVLETVESFPTFRVHAGCPPPAGVLALPAHSIYSSQTQCGDKLLVCAAEELEQRLTGVLAAPASAPVQNAALLREAPLWSGGPGRVEFKPSLAEERDAKQKHEMAIIKPGSKSRRLPRKWLERWWSPDPRKAPSDLRPGPAAYYWTGDAPIAHGVRDISSSGVYVVTEERWYPGTLVLMTAERSESGEEVAESSLAVETRGVRWGHDGVALQFVLADRQALRRGGLSPLDGINGREFEKFLERLKRQQ